MKTFKKSLSLLFSLLLLVNILVVTPAYASTTNYEFTDLTKATSTVQGRIEKSENVDYYKITINKRSKVALLAYNGNLEDYRTLTYKIFKDKNLTNQIHKDTLKVTDTDMWSSYKTLNAGTYYITLSSKKTFKYYLKTDIIPNPKFVKLKDNKVITGKIAKSKEIDYYKFTVKKKSRVSLCAYNGGLENYQNLKCRIYKDKSLTNRVYKGNIRVTDTDIFGVNKTLNPGTYYVTLTSKNTFKYYLMCDMIPKK